MTQLDKENQAEFTSKIRPLTADEYLQILTTHPFELRISDGSAEGTWRFWVERDQLFYRRQSWTQNKSCDTSFMQMILDGDGTMQLVAEGGD